MSLGYFVYYRVEPATSAQARLQVELLFEQLERACGVRGRLLTKRGEQRLWMEIYEPVADAAAFEATMEAELQSLDFARLLLPGSRRVTECFEG